MKHPHIFVVDDDAAVRDGLSLLMRAAQYDVSGFDSAEALLESGRLDKASCIILDLRLPGMSGAELQMVLNERHVTAPIVFLTGHGDIPRSVQAIKAGAHDFLTKPVEGRALLARVQAAIEVDTARRNEIARNLAVRESLDRLSARECEVLRLLVQGNSNKEVGRALGISHRTVEVHRARILLKTSASTLIDLATLARIGGLVSDART